VSVRETLASGLATEPGDRPGSSQLMELPNPMPPLVLPPAPTVSSAGEVTLDRQPAPAGGRGFLAGLGVGLGVLAVVVIAAGLAMLTR
jgi:hypothetical protein